jgi:hypothetical protein
LPPRLSTPGFHSGIRYKAIDGQNPRFAAYYEHDLGTLQTPAYKKLFAERSDLEAKIFEKIPLSRREYKLMSTHGRAAVNKPAKVIVHAGVTPQKGAEDAFNKWYVEVCPPSASYPDNQGTYASCHEESWMDRSQEIRQDQR